MASPLESCGKSLFFEVANPGELNLVPPANRKGEAVRTCVRSLSIMQKEALVVSSKAGTVWRLSSDEGPYLLGEDIAPCPLAFMTTGMVASYMNEMLVLAKQREIGIRRVRLIQDNYYTMTGSMLGGTMKGGALPVELCAEIDADGVESKLLALLQDAVEKSPMNGFLRGKLTNQFTLTHNGRQIETDRVEAIEGTAAPDPGDCFDVSIPKSGDPKGLVTRKGMTPKTGEGTSSIGSSYAEDQDRRLHLRGICTLRDDGVKQIEQHLYNPHGSIFHFLSDESEAEGGKGLAPDAATYLSAGIAFCFMTQFGRYAKIVKKELQEYRIVQDTHFSSGGRSGDTDEVGEVDPVETHVYLVTGEADDFALQTLDMSEQTCFLHALCRTDLRVHIRLKRIG